MRPGKVSENVLKRSVLKQIHTKREEVICGAGLGENCAVFSFSEGEYMLVSTHQNTIAVEDCTRFCIHKAANNLAAAGAEPVAVELALLLPESLEESQLRAQISQAEETCRELNIQLSGGSTKVSKKVNTPVATVTGIGRRM